MAADPKPWGVLFKASMALAVRRLPPEQPKTVTRRVEDRWAKCGAGRELWVRETWAPADDLLGLTEGYDNDPPSSVIYRADHHAYICTGSPERPLIRADDRDLGEPPRGWRPSLLMPRWASRTTLRTVSVTPEQWTPDTRLDDDEARREGFASADEFHALWDAMHPGFTGTVWRVEFERVERVERP